jgi:hypothetical protein
VELKLSGVGAWLAWALPCAAMSFGALASSVEVLTPEMPGEYVLVKDPTAAKLAPLVETDEPVDDAIAFTNYARDARAVAFEKLPRLNLLHSWKGLGTKVLKMVRYRAESTAEHFRREAGFMAFQDGADGLWLPDAAELPPNFRAALDEAREDWRILLYLRELRDKAAASADGIVRTDANRVTYWFGYMPAGWENLDGLRLECVAWAKRLEQVLGLPEAKLPVTCPAEPVPGSVRFEPFADLGVQPQEAILKGADGKRVSLGGGLEFRADYAGFSLAFSTTNGPEIAKWSVPGGTLDFRIYLPGKHPGDWLPYRFHCDLEKAWTGPRAPAIGRGSFLFGTDERFKPYSIAYGVRNIRIQPWPRLRSYGPDYPDMRPLLAIVPNTGGGWRAVVSVGWLSLYGHWPMQEMGTRDVWCVGLDRSPDTGKSVACRLVWPRGSAAEFKKIAGRINTGSLSRIYMAELNRTYEVWMTAFRERYYPFAKTANPCFNRYDLESDEMFRARLVQPLVDVNENAWRILRTDKEHKPKLDMQPEAVKMEIWKMLGRMLYLSHDVGLLRRDYLAGRFAGKDPPEPAKKVDHRRQAPLGPDLDGGGVDIQLDDIEF